MVGPSTTRALNSRALTTADWLHLRAKDLEEKLGFEVPYEEHTGSIRIKNKDGTPVMVELNASYLANLIFQMHQYETMLRRYAERPRTKLRRF